MSKEALNKLREHKSFYGESGFSLYGEFGETICASFAQSFADQEKEKVAVAFAEWKDKNAEFVCDGVYHCFSIGVDYTLSDLYQYFINNVYNQNHPL